MNEAVNIVFGNGFCDSFGAFDMNIFKIKFPRKYQQEQLLQLKSSGHAILCRVVSSNKIVNDIRVSNAFFEGRRISEVIFLFQ